MPLLRQHGLDIMAHDLLQQAGCEPTPEPLQTRYRLGVVARLASEKIYGELIAALVAKGVGFVVQKGVWLSCQVYPVPHWRQYADIDLLVAAQEMRKIDTLLRASGFRVIYSALPGREELPTWVDGQVIDVTEYKQDLYSVDVHYNLVPHQLPHRVCMAAVWGDRCRGTLKLSDEPREFPIWLLSPEDTVLHLLQHAAYHRMEAGFRVFLDLLYTLQYFRQEWDWDRFAARCQQFEVGYLVVGPLALMLDLLDFAAAWVPRQLLRRLDPSGRVLASYASKEFLRKFVMAPASLAAGQRHFFAVVQTAGMGKQLRAAWHHLFPGPRRMAARYNLHPYDPRTYLMYLARPLALAYRYLPRLIKAP